MFCKFLLAETQLLVHFVTLAKGPKLLSWKAEFFNNMTFSYNI